MLSIDKLCWVLCCGCCGWLFQQSAICVVTRFSEMDDKNKERGTNYYYYYSAFSISNLFIACFRFSFFLSLSCESHSILLLRVLQLEVSTNTNNQPVSRRTIFLFSTFRWYVLVRVCVRVSVSLIGTFCAKIISWFNFLGLVHQLLIVINQCEHIILLFSQFILLIAMVIVPK